MTGVILEMLEQRRLLASTAVLTGIGALGDSYTDEYQFYPPDRSTSRNFVEALAKDRSLNFGAFTTASRGEPRNEGFEYNWARDGATTADLAAQVEGIVPQIKAGKVTLVWLFAGGDDFLDALDSIDPVGTVRAAVPAAIKNITDAAKNVLAADPNVKLVMATLPDLRRLPIVRDAIAIAPRAIVQTLAGLQQKFNLAIARFATGKSRIALANGQQFEQRLFSKKHLITGGTEIDRTTPGDNLNDLFLADQIHIGTVGQGLLVNLFIKTVNRKYHAKIAPLTDQEILTK